MTHPPDPVPERSVRAADADRDAVAEQLQSAVADGRLDLTELDERLAATYAARTRAELDVVTSDLPAPPVRDTGTLTLKTQSGSLRKEGYWVVPALIVAECTSGTIRIDFTQAVCSHQEVTIQAMADAGSIVMTVPPGWGVDMDNASSSSGSLVNRVTQRAEPGAPVLRIVGKVRSGAIRASHPRRTFRQWLLRRPAAGHRR
ncbi:DUF1707 SHOCT-like domain-containing protein [Phytoactinopolyspora limicola]|uniref:DUF1707 SHOCT-like domain-containing protein n=1 Tax=Phytoactinopolyspora limicola TaxID=2715536 RepID=UPI00140AE1B1|nr:DUF1707 domain-containing protein [Phytoactinopolyspora limicola]